MTDDEDDRSINSQGRPLTAAALDSGHRMFQRYLESAYPEALGLAEDVLRQRPDDPMALAVYRECLTALGAPRDKLPTAPGTDPPPPGADGPTEQDAPYDRDATPQASSIAPPRSGNNAGRMYALFLAGDFRGALALSEEILDAVPEDDLARAVRSQSCDALGIQARVPALRRSSAHFRAVTPDMVEAYRSTGTDHDDD